MERIQRIYVLQRHQEDIGSIRILQSVLQEQPKLCSRHDRRDEFHFEIDVHAVKQQPCDPPPFVCCRPHPKLREAAEDRRCFVVARPDDRLGLTQLCLNVRALRLELIVGHLAVHVDPTEAA